MSEASTADEQILTNARMLVGEEIVSGSLSWAGDSIRTLDGSPSRMPAADDLEGDYLIPGLIELHTDNLEKHFQPRQGVVWDAVSAAISHDTQVAGSGITTVYDSLTLGAAKGWDARAEMVMPMIEGLKTAIEHDMLRVDHLLHMRCEVTHENIGPIFETFVDDPLVRLMSLMDHAPGDRQQPDIERYRRILYKSWNDPVAVDEHIDRLLDGSRRFGPGNRQRLSRIARDHRIPLASHDDARRAHIDEAQELGASISEFPTTLEAAEAANDKGLAVLMGAPNLIRGGSHSGNIAAGELAKRGLLNILSSDYIPASLVQAAFGLTTGEFGIPVPTAIDMVTRNPARAAGLDDRGELSSGKRADLVRVRIVKDRPIVRAVWSKGERVA